MSLLEELTAHSIDIDRYVALQNEFIAQCRQRLEAESKAVSYREYVEKDQLLTRIEKLINKLEREVLQRRIQELSSLSSP